MSHTDSYYYTVPGIACCYSLETSTFVVANIFMHVIKEHTEVSLSLETYTIEEYKCFLQHTATSYTYLFCTQDRIKHN